MLPEPKRRVRWLSDLQEKLLFSALPEHLRPIVLFALSTGLRTSNVTGLRWSQVDLKNRIVIVNADELETGIDLGVLLNDDALYVLKHQAGKHPENVFIYQGKPIKNAGWSKFDTVKKYAHISPQHLQEHARKISVTNLAHAMMK